MTLATAAFQSGKMNRKTTNARENFACAPSTDPPHASATGANENEIESQPERTDSMPINILLVDDEHKNLTVLETILDDPSYRLIKAESADQALLALLAEEFALLILDIRMPGATGIELAHMIKQRKKTADIPIIFLTAYYNEDQHILEGYGAGAVDYLHKPIKADILRSKVAVFAQLYRMQRTLRAEVAERQLAERQLKVLNDTLEQRVLERTRALRANAALLQATTDNASVGLASVGIARCYAFANPAYIRIFSLPDDIIGRNLVDLAAPEDAEQITSLLDSAYAGERSACELTRSVADAEPARSSHYSVIFEPERDAQGNIAGVVIVVFDITERKKTEEHVAMLLREVNHRSKNMLSIVSAIARQTKAPSRDDYIIRFSDRIHALAASHDLLSSKQWQAIAITELISAQLSHFQELMGSRVTIEGPAVSLSAASAQFLGMVVHELATNAAKHGALSNQAGRVSLRWEIDRTPDDQRFTVVWIESDGPPVVPPSQRGYGSTVIKSMAELSLDGRVALDFAPSGLRWRLDCPAGKVLYTAATNSSTDDSADHGGRP